MESLKPFWRYYGGKNRAARLYPAPEYDTVIEPFAGAAGYSCRYSQKRVVLVDKSPIIAGIWEYLIAVSEEEVRQLPDIPVGGTVEDLPSWVPQEALWLIGFWANSASVHPGKRQSARAREAGQDAPNWNGWGWRARTRIAANVGRIRHWKVICGDYRQAPDIEATWYVDPPYSNRAGSLYPHQPDDFTALGDWCRARQGLVIACENEGATWLPFRPLAAIKSQEGKHGKGKSMEVIWTNRTPQLRDGGQRVFAWGAV